MDTELFRAATKGSVKRLEHLLEKKEVEILEQETKTKDTTIHIAARHGRLEFVKYVQRRYPVCLLIRPNSKGDTPFHVSARAGHPEIIQFLFSCVLSKSSVSSSQQTAEDVELGEAETDREVLRRRNNIGDTPMHDAVRNRRLGVVKKLIELDPELLREDNINTGESPLHAAVEKGKLEIVKEILHAAQVKCSTKGPNGRTALHAAILHNRRDAAKLLLERHRELATVADDNNRSPMHFATTVRSLQLTKLLLKYDTSTASSLDKTGVAPIHIAALYGQTGIIKVLRKCCPHLENLLDSKHRNLLHFAIEGKETSLVKYILGQKDFKDAVNEKDKDGNTPLHQATLSCQPHAVSLLVNKKGIDKTTWNKQGLSASAIAVSQSEDEKNYNHEKVLVLVTILHAARPKWCKKFKSGKEIMRLVIGRKLTLERYKEKASPLMVVAALVAGVTFAAGFTIPGGYFSNEAGKEIAPNAGTTILIGKPGFKEFLTSDARALYLSTLAVIALIGVQLIDSVFPAALMFYLGRLLTMFALVYQVLAFEFGVGVTTDRDPYLLFSSSLGYWGNLILVIGIILAFFQPFFPFLYCFKFYVCFRCWLNQTWVGGTKPRNSYKQYEEDVAALLRYEDAKSE